MPTSIPIAVEVSDEPLECDVVVGVTVLELTSLDPHVADGFDMSDIVIGDKVVCVLDVMFGENTVSWPMLSFEKEEPQQLSASCTLQQKSAPHTPGDWQLTMFNNERNSLWFCQQDFTLSIASSTYRCYIFQHKQGEFHWRSVQEPR